MLRVYQERAICAFGCILGFHAPAWAQPSAPADGSAIPLNSKVSAEQTRLALTDIVVTAQKRSQAIDDVGMAITAATGDELKVQEIRATSGLTKIDPSFIVSASAYAAPVYSLRGINYNDFSLAATPAVSIYSDEIPYAYPALTKGASYDLQRVEILKGPQGTLFGQNSTGGAIDYISAKPTDHIAAGLEGTYATYDAVNINGFLSGPITNTLDARLAFDVDEGGAWQRSDTRRDALGREDTQKARLLLAWKPADRLSISINLNGWLDKSQTQAGQTIGFNPAIAAFAPALAPLKAAIQQNQLYPHDARSANWLAGTHPADNEQYGQISVRAEYRISDTILLTYLGSYESYHQSDLLEPSGADINFSLQQAGSVHSDSQEGRLSGTSYDKKLIWLVGASYEENITSENQLETLSGTTAVYSYASFLTALNKPVVPYAALRNASTDDSKSTAGFCEHRVPFGPPPWMCMPAVRIYADRYRNTVGVRGMSAAQAWRAWMRKNVALVAKANAAGAHDNVIPAAPNGCVTLGPTLNPTYYQGELDQNNLSWAVRGATGDRSRIRSFMLRSARDTRRAAFLRLLRAPRPNSPT